MTESSTQTPTPEQLDTALRNTARLPEQYRIDSDESTTERYRVLELLGHGGMGTVWRAQDTDCDREVAVKMQHPGMSQGRSLARFVEEAQVTGQLEHPDIVPVHELGVTGSGQIFYAMQCVRGRTLRDVLKALRKGDKETMNAFPLTRLIEIFQKVCEAVAYAHSRGVLHRDLKPDNIMIGEFGQVYLMDWGLTKLTDSRDEQFPVVESVRQEQALMTMAGEMMGTPGYMAPEQFRESNQNMDQRTDAFGLGAVLYHILVLRGPFHASSSAQVVARNMKAKVRFPKTDKTSDAYRHLPDRRCPGALEAICRKALQPAKANRYQTAADLLSDIERYRSGRPPLAEKANLLRQLQLLVKRNPFQAGLSAAATTAIVIASAFFIVGLHTERLQAAQYRRIADKSRTLAASYETQTVSALQSIQDNANVFYRAAQREIAAINPAGAAAHLQNGLRLQPHNPEFHRMLGNVYQTLFRFQDSINAYEKALSYCDSAKPDLQKNLDLSKDLLTTKQHYRENAVLTAELRRQGRHAEAQYLSRQLGHAIAKHADVARKRFKDLGYDMRVVATADSLSIYNNPPIIQARDFKFLRGLPITRVFWNNGKLTSLEGLEELPLRYISMWGSDYTNVDPLRGAPLESAVIYGNPKLTDISGLKGIPIKRLYIRWSNVKEISPLKGAPLEFLDCDRAPIEDLSPLKGSPMHALNAAETKVRDLSPLSQIPLMYLCLEDTPVEDLSPLRTVPLRCLWVNKTKVTDLSPLKDVPLYRLVLNDTEVADLSPLKGSRIRSLAVSNTNVTDFTPIMGLDLARFEIGGLDLPSYDLLAGFPNLIILKMQGSAISDTSIFDKLKLKELDLSRCRNIKDFSFLARQNLDRLVLNGSSFSDLTVLAGAKLKLLSLNRCKELSDLTAVQTFEVEELQIRKTGVTDLRPLATCKIKKLRFDPAAITHGLDDIRRNESIQQLSRNGWQWLPPDRFWTTLNKK